MFDDALHAVLTLPEVRQDEDYEPKHGTYYKSYNFRLFLCVSRKIHNYLQLLLKCNIIADESPLQRGVFISAFLKPSAVQELQFLNIE
jgi:hypothetical protein